MKNCLTAVAFCLALASAAPAATLELQLAAYNITGLDDGDLMWSGDNPIPWPDATANNRDAVAPHDYWAPNYETGEAGKFNSQDYLYYGNSDSMIGSASLSGWGFTAMVVGNFANTSGSRYLMRFYDADNSNRHLSFSILDDGNLQVVYRESSWPQYILKSTDQDFRGGDHLFEVVYQGATDIDVYVDSTAVSMTYSGSETPSVTFSGIDSYNVGAGSNDADIAEARYYSGSWDTGEREAVENDLMNTYGIPEPATAVLLLSGAALLRRRRR